MKERRRVWANYFHVNNFTCLSFRLTSEISPQGCRKIVQPREERLDRFTCVSVYLFPEKCEIWINLQNISIHCVEAGEGRMIWKISKFIYIALDSSRAWDIVNCLDSAPCTHQSTKVRYRVCADTANNIGFAARFLPKAPLSFMRDTAHVWNRERTLIIAPHLKVFWGKDFVYKIQIKLPFKIHIKTVEHTSKITVTVVTNFNFISPLCLLSCLIEMCFYMNFIIINFKHDIRRARTPPTDFP